VDIYWQTWGLARDLAESHLVIEGSKDSTGQPLQLALDIYCAVSHETDETGPAADTEPDEIGKDDDRVDFSPVQVRKAARSWKTGKVFSVVRGEVETLLVPASVLSPEIILDALSRWYMVRFDKQEGHWAVAERRLPEFVLDLGVVEAGEPHSERSYTRQAAKGAIADAIDELAALAPTRTPALWKRFDYEPRV
jgi:hypothetical protein